MCILHSRTLTPHASHGKYQPEVPFERPLKSLPVTLSWDILTWPCLGLRRSSGCTRGATTGP